MSYEGLGAPGWGLGPKGASYLLVQGLQRTALGNQKRFECKQRRMKHLE